jgi:hypothetical protein
MPVAEDIVAFVGQCMADNDLVCELGSEEMFDIPGVAHMQTSTDLKYLDQGALHGIVGQVVVVAKNHILVELEGDAFSDS